MKTIPHSVLLVIIFLIVNIIIESIGAFLNHQNFLQLLNDKNIKIPVNPTSFVILVYSFNGLIKSLIALALYLKVNWVRVFFLIITFISLPFSIYNLIFTNFNFELLHQIYGVSFSLLVIYALIKNKEWFKNNE
ncbi:MAG: DUF2127 domain-containing protein [Bacteriovoracaceae bacterium]